MMSDKYKMSFDPLEFHWKWTYLKKQRTNFQLNKSINFLCVANSQIFDNIFVTTIIFTVL